MKIEKWICEWTINASEVALMLQHWLWTSEIGSAWQPPWPVVVCGLSTKFTNVVLHQMEGGSTGESRTSQKLPSNLPTISSSPSSLPPLSFEVGSLPPCTLRLYYVDRSTWTAPEYHQWQPSLDCQGRGEDSFAANPSQSQN
jgi:hypothetical protein